MVGALYVKFEIHSPTLKIVNGETFTQAELAIPLDISTISVTMVTGIHKMSSDEMTRVT